MSTYPVTIRRCQHIKVNGIQCGSPAKRNEKHCYFHEQCRLMSRQINMKFSEHGIIKLPTLEDANSIQLGLAEVMRLLVTQQIDHRTASLLLRALRTAAANVKFTSLEPKPTHIVIDPETVENRPLGATAWSTVEGRDYDLVDNDGADKAPANKNADKNEEKNAGKNQDKEDKMDDEARRCLSDLMRLTAGVARDPKFLDRPEASPEASPEARPEPQSAAEAQPPEYLPMSEYRQRRNREIGAKSLFQNILHMTPLNSKI